MAVMLLPRLTRHAARYMPQMHSPSLSFHCCMVTGTLANGLWYIDMAASHHAYLGGNCPMIFIDKYVRVTTDSKQKR